MVVVCKEIFDASWIDYGLPLRYLLLCLKKSGPFFIAQKAHVCHTGGSDPKQYPEQTAPT